MNIYYTGLKYILVVPRGLNYLQGVKLSHPIPELASETTRVLTVRKAEVRSRMFIVLDWPTDLQDCVGSI